MPETAEATANTPESAPAPNLEAEFQAQTQQATDPYFVDENGLAIRGTDPVAYFTEGAAVPGRAEFSYRWGNATWQFSSAAHRDQFAANPEQYAPQYGGFCAWAVSQGYTAPIDPNAWRIVDGRLYLNFSPGVQRRWERNIPGNIAQANVNWPSVYEGQ
ncbi:MAG: YHS domain-containing (seleno)protein [Cyanobacteria bacterium J06632_22]